jgi:hypothetical protein
MTTRYEEVYQQVMAEKYAQNGYAHQIAGVY